VPAIAVVEALPGGPLDTAMTAACEYRWIVVTSANGARAALNAAARTGRRVDRTHWAAIGRSTATVLERGGVAAEFVPSASDAAAIATELPLDLGDRVLLIRGHLAASELPDRLRQRGATVDDVVAYRTEIAPAASRGLLREAVANRGVGAVMFTSGSTVDGLLAIADAEGIDAREFGAICIGEETARAATTAGFRVIAVSHSQDVAALADAAARVLAPQLPEVIHA
jgi:uroporphyrinogen-III synthase